jgi:flagellar L-ring protein precursor FlgH
VRQILPSGDLFIEGTKVVMVGAEEKHIYLSGIVRRIDIADDNSVSSSRIADAEIEYAGRGDISDTQRRGWGSRVLSKLWPF